MTRRAGDSPTWSPLVAAGRALDREVRVCGAPIAAAAAGSAATVDRATDCLPVTDRVHPFDGATESAETRRTVTR